MVILKSLDVVIYIESDYVKAKPKPQLLCIVVSAAQNGEFERFGGFTTCYEKKTQMKSSFLTASAPSRFLPRN